MTDTRLTAADRTAIRERHDAIAQEPLDATTDNDSPKENE